MLSKGRVLDIDFAEKSGLVAGDASRYGNNGALTGCKWVENGLEFNGTSDCVRIPDSESLSPTIAMSAMCWVKGAAQDNKGIFGHYDGGANQRAFFIGSNYSSPYNNIRFIISDTGSSVKKRYTSSIPVLDNTLHLIGFTFNVGTLKLFVDGIEDTNPTKTQDDAIATIYNSAADVMLGCVLNSDTPVNVFDGSIDHPQIYNRALNASEIKAYYDSTKHKYR